MYNNSNALIATLSCQFYTGVYLSDDFGFSPFEN